ncbi:hypothetical protein EGX99_01650 (plasmid) [Klebsiella pneumoniae]|nr:hypothetical protein EGX99_01650 [Klebsiella pneumoniae]
MGSCAAPSAKGDDKFITTDYLQQCPAALSAETRRDGRASATRGSRQQLRVLPHWTQANTKRGGV